MTGIIEYVKETLYHFSCKICNRWWTIGDWAPTKTLACPHCGHRGEVTEKVEKSEDVGVQTTNDLSLFINKANELIYRHRDSLERDSRPTSIPMHVTCGNKNCLVGVTLINTGESIIGIYCSAHIKNGVQGYVIYAPSGFKLISINNISHHVYLKLDELTEVELYSQMANVTNFSNTLW